MAVDVDDVKVGHSAVALRLTLFVLKVIQVYALCERVDTQYLDKKYMLLICKNVTEDNISHRFSTNILIV